MPVQAFRLTGSEALDPHIQLRANGPEALTVDNISYSYGPKPALEDVSLTVKTGTFTVLLGDNGAGKTTLINLITRLFVARSGSIRICGFDLESKTSEALASLGVVFQSSALDRSLTVAQNLIYHGALHGIPRGQTLTRGEELLTHMQLSDRMGDKVEHLSGGQQRRVEIARALLHRPRLILCDEATAGLDVTSRAALVADLHNLTKDGEVGVLWTTHLIDEVSPDDPVVVLHKGRVMASAIASELAGSGSLSDAFLALTRETGADA